MPFTSLSIRSSLGVRGGEILEGRGEFLSLSSFPFSLPPFPQRRLILRLAFTSRLTVLYSILLRLPYWYLISRGFIFVILTLKYEKAIKSRDLSVLNFILFLKESESFQISG